MIITKEKFEKDFKEFSMTDDPNFFNFRVLSYLRSNRQLLKDQHYHRLYWECIEYLKIRVMEKLRKDGIDFENCQTEFVMLLADMYTRCYGVEVDFGGEVRAYLEFRKGIWEVELI